VRWANCTAAAFDLLLTPECVLLPKPEWWHDGALKTLSKTVVRVVDNGHGHMMRATVLSGLQPAWEVSPRSAADLKEAAKHYSLAAKLASPHGQGHPPSPSGSASAPPQGAPAAAPFRLCGGADLFPGEEERPGQRPGHCAPRHRLVCSSQPVPNSPYPRALPPHSTTQARGPVQKLEFGDLAATHLRKAAATEAAEAATEAAEAEAKALVRAEAEAKANAAADALLALLAEEKAEMQMAAAAARAGKAGSKGKGKGKRSGKRCASIF
jgi:hypothetical protein